MEEEEEEGIRRSEEEVIKRRFKRICVFCGSRAGYKASFGDAALDLGRQLVLKNIDLVYGGGSVGLMGLISSTVFNGGCHVLGVIPRALMPHEISGETIGEVITVADMHQRKSEMARHADAFIALPGGYGTMEELMEMIAWSQLGIHEKPELKKVSLMILQDILWLWPILLKNLSTRWRNMHRCMTRSHPNKLGKWTNPRLTIVLVLGSIP